MFEFRFIHAADLHLDSPLKGLEKYDGAPVDEIREACRRALSNLVQLAIEENVSFVLFAGDIYDGNWKDYNTGLFFIQQVTALQKAGICVYAITGNHDAENKMTRSLLLPENPNGTAVMLPNDKPATVQLPDISVAIHGRGFKTAKEPNNIVLKYPASIDGYFNIGMLHTALTGAEGHETYAPCSPTDLYSRQYDYWALGHVHARRRIEEAGQPPIVFPGNIQGRHIRETGKKGCELVTVSGSGEVEMSFRTLDVLRWELCDVDATEAESIDDIIDQAAVQLRKLANSAGERPLSVRFRVKGQTAAHEELIASRTNFTQQLRARSLSLNHDIWIEKVKLQTSPAETQQPAVDGGAVEELLNYFDELHDDEALLNQLRQELKPLVDRLGGLDDFLVGDEPAIPVNSEQVRSILHEVKPMLLHRLGQKETSA